ncbi:MAG: amidohydrolase [Bryobacterales bacterium]|nr:amidohydrolase [Bryobacterales bacterium]
MKKITLCLILAALHCLSAAAQNAVIEAVETRAEHFGQVSRQIWENPELGFHETRSSALLRDELKAAGFRITENVAGLPTAFVAEWGSGKPVIGIIGEYDALPGLSQEVLPERKARVEEAPGHGCGHNLFGSASALAAVVVKEQIEKRGLKGTLRFYGTPAEEGGGGKIYMIRAGAFKDADAVLVWHPFDRNQADANPWLANISANIHFEGLAAHAAAAPDAGRSALDAVELTAHAINMLREHVPQETRMHYIITNGGQAANIVPAQAEMKLLVRHPSQKTLESIWERVLNCAQAGALATGTTMRFSIQSAYSNIMHTPALVSLLDRNLREAGGVRYTAEERGFAEAIRRHLPDPSTALALGSESTILPPRTELLSASTDVGDVSQVVPTGHFLAATFPPGTPLHTWMSTAAAGSSLGREGMAVAAKTLALSATELFANPALVAQARSEWEKARGGQEYRSLLPMDKKPPVE